jgi:hypothetical protein
MLKDQDHTWMQFKTHSLPMQLLKFVDKDANPYGQSYGPSSNITFMNKFTNLLPLLHYNSFSFILLIILPIPQYNFLQDKKICFRSHQPHTNNFLIIGILKK